MLVTCLVLLFVVLPIAASVIVWQKAVERDRFVRILISLLPLAFSAFAFETLYSVCVAGQFDWNGAKLAPILAMTHGFPLYGDRDTGVMSAWIYGPVPAFFFLPTAIFTRPTTVIIASVIINLIATTAPTVWALLRVRRNEQTGRNEWLAVSVAGLIFLWVVNPHESLRRVMFMAGPDGPTITLMAISCLVLLGPKRGLPRLIVSAVCAVLACWCKQSVIPFLIIGPIYVAMLDGFRAFVQSIAALAISGLLISAILVISFGPSNMWFQMVEVSSHHGFTDNEHGNVIALLYGLGDLIVELAPTLILFALLMLFRSTISIKDADGFPTNWREQITTNDGTGIFLLTSIVMIPSSILGYMKVGGYLNNFALSHYFLLLALCVYFARSWPLWRENSRGIARWTLAAACLFVIGSALPTVTLPDTISASVDRIAHPYDNAQEVVYNYDLARPHVGYFPWNNLAVLQAEGQLYHFEWGLVDRFEAGLNPSADQLRAHIPKNVAFIAYGPLHQSERTTKYLQETLGLGSLSKIPIPDLPNFSVVTHLMDDAPPSPSTAVPQPTPTVPARPSSPAQRDPFRL